MYIGTTGPKPVLWLFGLAPALWPIQLLRVNAGPVRRIAIIILWQQTPIGSQKPARLGHGARDIDCAQQKPGDI